MRSLKKMEKKRPQLEAEISSAAMKDGTDVSQWVVAIAWSQNSGFTRCHGTLFDEK